MDGIDAIICDIDGCLSPEQPRPSATGLLARVAEYNERARGGACPALTLCTGRPLAFAEAMGRVVGAFGLPIVCEGGVWLLDLGSYTWEMDPRITRGHVAMMHSLRGWIAEEFAPLGVFFEEGKSAAVTVFHKEIAVLRGEVLPRIDRRIEGEGLPMRVSMTWTCINVELGFVSKATGLDRLLARCGLEPARLAGIGDTMSDLAMRERVGFFACPNNADPALKEHADYVSPGDEAEGVLEILEYVTGGR